MPYPSNGVVGDGVAEGDMVGDGVVGDSVVGDDKVGDGVAEGDILVCFGALHAFNARARTIIVRERNPRIDACLDFID